MLIKKFPIARAQKFLPAAVVLFAIPLLMTKQAGANETLSVVVKKVQLQGDAALLSENQYQLLEQSVVGREIGKVELRSLIAQIKQQLRDMGYMTSLVHIPPQDITSGDLKVVITIGRLDAPAFEIASNVEAKAKGHAERVLSTKLVEGNPLKQHDLEESMLKLNAIPGITANSKMAAGSLPGTTKIQVEVDEYKDEQVSWDLANTGNNTTGIEVLTGQWQWQNPFENHSKYEFGLTKSAGMTNLSAKRHWAPTHNGNWYAGINHVEYSSITSDPTTSGLHGRSVGGELGYHLPLVELLKTSSSLDFSYHASSIYDANELGGANMVISDKQISHIDVKYKLRDTDVFLNSSQLTLESTLSVGQINLPTDSNIIQNLTIDQTAGGGAFTNGQYTTLNMSADYTHSFAPDWQWYGHLSGQLANKNLDGSAKFSLGGPNGVRAYPAGEGSADEGALMKLELRWQPKRLADYHAPKFTVFYDAGYAKLYDNPDIGGGISINTDLRKNEYGLEGNGFSIVGTPSTNHQWSITYAHKSGTNPGRDFMQNDSDGANSANRYWFKWQSRF